MNKTNETFIQSILAIPNNELSESRLQISLVFLLKTLISVDNS